MHIAKTHQWGFPPGAGLPQIRLFAVSLCNYGELIETESATTLYAGAGGGKDMS